MKSLSILLLQQNISACCPEFLVLICEFFTVFSLFKTNTIKELAEVKDRILTLRKETFQVHPCTFVILENSSRLLLIDSYNII